MTAITLRLKPVFDLTDDAFYELCRANPDVKFERAATGELVVMSPTGGETGDRNRRLTQRLGNWADEDNTGLAFDSSTGFKLPNGAERYSYGVAVRTPKVSWIRGNRWAKLTPEQRRQLPQKSS